ncbi:hypothetical protein Murru_2643 [Allomuricauda ruestringensis DSM 13258]|uniref:Uncharacterized protein n=1 Tax=Allomuricauda ruestringensis (strain DSM 13258 / CIP 107369 / LMG 19739 / B1) TaxID=886377 RepID=G2PQP1_ALLRU|nr:hypothetical protein [Allomuricauda ruestringensis]AEM71678.1 hypothetical protein Murru_2643 [Allomuricauda ruestringensis DSM 13258]
MFDGSIIQELMVEAPQWSNVYIEILFGSLGPPMDQRNPTAQECGVNCPVSGSTKKFQLGATCELNDLFRGIFVQRGAMTNLVGVYIQTLNTNLRKGCLKQLSV